jgi:hypothetical protein
MSRDGVVPHHPMTKPGGKPSAVDLTALALHSAGAFPVVFDEVWCRQRHGRLLPITAWLSMMGIIFASALILPLAWVVARSFRRRKRRQLDLGVVSDQWMAQQRGRESPQE